MWVYLAMVSTWSVSSRTVRALKCARSASGCIGRSNFCLAISLLPCWSVIDSLPKVLCPLAQRDRTTARCLRRPSMISIPSSCSLLMSHISHNEWLLYDSSQSYHLLRYQRQKHHFTSFPQEPFSSACGLPCYYNGLESDEKNAEMSLKPESRGHCPLPV